MILNDKEIFELVKITKIDRDLKPAKTRISKGYSSFGYDLTLSPIIEELCSGTIDPKDFKNSPNLSKRTLHPCLTNEVPDYVIIPPGAFVLGCSLEYLKIPEDVIGICVGKSTYARCGLIVNVTPLEPGWEGQVTLELHNTSKCSIKVYTYEGICQVNFHKGNRPNHTYADKKGKYQGQKGIVYPKG